MKKALAVLLIASVAQGSLLQGQFNQYKYLNRLDKASYIRRNCEGLYRWSPFSWNAAQACDAFDDMFDVYAQAREELEKTGDSSFFSENCLRAVAATKRVKNLKIYNDATETLISPDTSMSQFGEAILLSALRDKIIAEEVSKLEKVAVEKTSKLKLGSL